MTISNPKTGAFINWKNAYGGELARSSSFGMPCVRTFNHLRRWRSGEYVASYSGRCNVAINGNDVNRFHIITRFPVQSGGGTVPVIITSKKWKRGYGVVVELWDWYKDYTDGAADPTLYSAAAPLIAVTTDDTANSKASGTSNERKAEVEPQGIGTNDGFRCSRLNVDNAMLHRLNVFRCPMDGTLDADQAVVYDARVSPGEALRGYVDGTDDGTLGALIHYMDGDTDGTDSVIHNTCRPLFNTPYALGAHVTNEAGYVPIRSDANAVSMTYQVKARNLTGGAGVIPCDIAVVISGDVDAAIKFTSSVDNSTYTLVAGDAAPILRTTSDFSDTLNIAAAGDEITIEALSGAGNDIYIHAVSLWEPYQHR